MSRAVAKERIKRTCKACGGGRALVHERTPKGECISVKCSGCGAVSPAELPRTCGRKRKSRNQ